MKKTVALILALMIALFACLSVCVAEEAENADTIQKYGSLGRLSKLGVTEDQLNELLWEFWDYGICDKYIYYDTMNDMIMALNKGDIIAFVTDQNTARYIASRNDNIVDRAPYGYPNMLTFCMLLREEDAELRDQLSACIAEMNEDGTIEAMNQTYIEDVIAGEDPEAVELQAFPGAETITYLLSGSASTISFNFLIWITSAADDPPNFATFTPMFSSLFLSLYIIFFI